MYSIYTVKTLKKFDFNFEKVLAFYTWLQSAEFPRAELLLIATILDRELDEWLMAQDQSALHRIPEPEQGVEYDEY